MSKAQSRRRKNNLITKADKVDQINRLLDTVHPPAKAIGGALKSAETIIEAQALQIAGYEQIIIQQQAVLAGVSEIFGALTECQTIEEVHTTIQQALDSGLLPTGDKPHEQ